MTVNPPPIIYLALGTNLGDRFANLQAAIAALPPAVRVLAQSPVYETPPWGLTDQPAFLNMVLKGQTALAPVELLKRLKLLETGERLEQMAALTGMTPAAFRERFSAVTRFPM